MRLNTDYFDRCIRALETSFDRLQQFEPGQVLDGLPDVVFYDIFRAASVKEFEIILEQCGKLLQKRLRPYLASNRQADELTFKNRFRRAAKHGLISVDACERWLMYRDSRNDTAHHYGAQFAEATLKLLPGFIIDAKQMAEVLSEPFDD